MESDRGDDAGQAGSKSSVEAGLLVGLCLLLMVGAGCRTRSAATLPDGSPVQVWVAPELTLAPDVPPERARQLEDLVAWMEEDLVHLLQQLGYQAARLDGRSVDPGLGGYVLRFRVTRYDAGGPSGFFVDRTGAPTRIDTDFQLVGAGGVVVDGHPMVDGVPDWRKAARLVDKKIRDRVNGNLRLVY